MNEIMIKNFEGKEIRTNVDELGNIWFSTQDILDVLGIKYKSSATKRLHAHERGSFRCDTLGGNQEISSVNESGMYKLIMRSDKPQAQRLIDWITSEVLPALRKTGSYSLVPKKELSPLDILENHLKQMRALEAANQNMAVEIERVAIVARQDEDTLTSDQIGVLDQAISEKVKELKDVRYTGYIRKAIKKKYFKIIGSRTYKELRRSDFPEALILVRNFKAEPWMSFR